MGAAAIDPRFSFAPGASIVAIGGRDVLFSEAEQKVFDLDDVTGTVASQLARGATQHELVQRFVDHGVATPQATDLVRSLLASWSNAGLLAAEGAQHLTPEFDQVLTIAGVGIRLHYDSAALRDRIAPVFASLTGADTTLALSYSIRAVEGAIILARDARPAKIVADNAAVPALKACLVDDVLNAGSRIALHTASLVRDDRCLLLSGSPGAGKTTLAVALTAAGFGYAADDIVLLDDRGHAQGLPFPPTLKAGSWDLLCHDRDSIAQAPVHDRADGARVRYPTLSAAIRPEPLPVGWIVMLDRAPSGDAGLRPIDPLAALGALMDGAYARSGKTSTADLRMLIGLVTGASCFALRYADLDDAVRLLTHAVAGA